MSRPTFLYEVSGGVPWPEQRHRYPLGKGTFVGWQMWTLSHLRGFDVRRMLVVVVEWASLEGDYQMPCLLQRQDLAFALYFLHHPIPLGLP